jgi:PAS domain-containing protein
MASLIAWLAVRYRRAYERELQARNQALTTTRDFLSQVIDGAAEAIVTLDAGWRVTSWNRAAHQI